MPSTTFNGWFSGSQPIWNTEPLWRYFYPFYSEVLRTDIINNVQPPKEEEVSEMTVKDVEKLVGHKVKIVKE